MPFFNLYHSLGIFSRRQIDDIFLIFPSKQDLTFHANCLLKCQILFSGKNISKCCLLKILPRVQSIKGLCMQETKQEITRYSYLSCERSWKATKCIQGPLTLVLLNLDMPCLCKSVDLHHLEAKWSSYALFDIYYVNLYQQPGSDNLISWKLEVCVLGVGWGGGCHLNLFSMARVIILCCRIWILVEPRPRSSCSQV